MAKSRGWTCQRIVNGERCRTHNDPRKRKCTKCGQPRPPRRRPAHRIGLTAWTYEDYIALNGGEHCAICGRSRGSRRLDRDHDHATGAPRGLLCARCNRWLPSWMTTDWLTAAAAYLDRAASRAHASARPKTTTK